MKNIVFVAHCILNTASKVDMYTQNEIDREEALRKQFVRKSLENSIQLIQLPCPEFTLYGCRRWGHVSNQFDNVFFRNHCKVILAPLIDQLKEYLSDPERFQVLGFVGIDGSPSCGVDYTCYGEWFGSFEGRENLDQTLKTASLGKGSGVMMSVLKQMLNDAGLDNLPVTALFADEPQKCLNLLD